MSNRTQREDEWARHRDLLCLGILTIATAVTGAAVVVATNSDIPAQVGGGQLTVDRITWCITGGFGMGAYLAAILVAGFTMVAPPGRLTHRLERKQAGLLATQVLFSVEVVLLAAMLIISVVTAPGPPSKEDDKTPKNQTSRTEQPRHPHILTMPVPMKTFCPRATTGPSQGARPAAPRNQAPTSAPLRTSPGWSTPCCGRGPNTRRPPGAG